MIGPFQLFEQVLNLFEVRQAQLERLHDKWLSEGLFRGRQAQPQKAVHHLLKRLARFAGLLPKQVGYILVQSKSSSHIMMLML